MAQFEIVYEGQVREVYVVTADSRDEAFRTWPDGWLAQREVYDGEVVSVKEIEEEDA